MIRKAVQPFYREIFGWKFKKFEGGPAEYWLVTTGAFLSHSPLMQFDAASLTEMPSRQGPAFVDYEVRAVLDQGLAQSIG